MAGPFHDVPGGGNRFLDLLAWTWRVPWPRHPEYRASWLILVWMLFDAVVFTRLGAWAMVPLAVVIPALALAWHAACTDAVSRVIGIRQDLVRISIFGDELSAQVPLYPGRHLLYALTGPLASILVGLVCLLIAGIPLSVLFANPVNLILPMFGAAEVAGIIVHEHPLMAVVVYAGLINLSLGLLNLFPMAPLDGARIWRAVLWPIVGLAQSCRWNTRLALLCSIVLGICGVILQNLLLLIVSLQFFLCGIAVLRSVRNGYDPVLIAPIDVDLGQPSWWSQWRAARSAARAAAEDRRQAEEQAVLDRLLEKVSQHGLPSLTARERSELQAISRRQRERGDA